MKFISFGDLVEVTYDDGSIELVSKETAAELGYKERQIKISYNGKTYGYRAFSKLVGINASVIYNYYKKGHTDGKAILEAYYKQKASKTEINISYQGKMYNSSSFGKLADMYPHTVRDYYKRGYTTGEEILAEHQKYKTVKQNNTIYYKNKEYTVNEFSILTGIQYSTIWNYCKRGINDGETIIKSHTTYIAPRKDVKITYKNNQYSLSNFSKMTNIPYHVVKTCYKNKIRTGEEIIAYFDTNYQPMSKQKRQIIYNNKIYTHTKFAKLIGIANQTVAAYYDKGLHTGEEIITAYNSTKTSRHFTVTYQGQQYSLNKFKDISGIPSTTINRYYNLGLKAGEEMIERYYKNKR